MWILGFVAAIGRFVISFYQQEITEALTVNRTFISMTWSFNIAIAAICSPIGGWLTDKYGPKKVMVMNAVFGVLSMLTVITVDNAFGFFIGLGLLSGLSGIGATTGYVLVTRWFSRHRAKALMILTSASSLGLAILTPVFVSNRDWLDWMTAFTVTFWIGIVSIPLTILIIKDRHEETNADSVGSTGNSRNSEGADWADDSDRMDSTNSSESTDRAEIATVTERPSSKWNLSIYKEMIGNRTVLFVIFALFTCGFSMGTVEMHLMAIHQHAHVEPVMFASSLSLLGLLELTGGLLFAFMLDRISRTLALSFLYLFRVIAFTALFLHFDLSPILFSVIFGASYLGAVPGGMLVAGEKLGERSIGLQVGTLLIFHQAGAVLGSLSGGFFFDLTNSYQWLIGLNLLFSAVSAIGYYMIHSSARRRVASLPI
ncbi:MFS transporter [Cohnella herbarum]|uniref:MFS transporter n=1 Tax=Cohnella herbarum TaxID=2728023 RepID=UPI0020C4EFB9|nr:MFS transporter [Cohnella herbarum]